MSTNDTQTNSTLFSRENILFLIIVGLVIFLFISKTAQPTIIHDAPVITINSDTTDKQHTATIVNQPTIIKTIPYPVEQLTKEYVPNPNYDSLKAQFEKLRADFLATNVQKDSIKIDSLGSVSATTITTKNKVDSIKWDYKIKERLITTTITTQLPYKPKTQWFYGGGLSANTLYQIHEFEGGIMFKNKKDQIYGLKGEYNTVAGFQIGVQSYFKF